VGARIAVFGDKATSLAKGDRCYIDGRLKLESRTSRDGLSRSGLKVAAWKCEPIAKNKPAAKAPVDSAPAQACGNSNDWQRAGADEIPFSPEWQG
jgi:single-stranded DNA-binding protein